MGRIVDFTSVGRRRITGVVVPVSSSHLLGFIPTVVGKRFLSPKVVGFPNLGEQNCLVGGCIGFTPVSLLLAV